MALVDDLLSRRAPSEPWRDSGEPPKRFSFVYPSDIRLRPRKWLVRRLLQTSGIGVLFGPSGCGKSFWAIDLALSLATGGEFLGRSLTQTGVVYVAAEDAEGVQFRTRAWMRHHDTSDLSIPFAIVPEAPDLWNADKAEADRLIDAIREEASVLAEMGASPGLIIIDTYRDAFPGLEENDSGDVSKATKTLARISRELGALVLVVAHVSKGGDGEDPRGSTALIGAADVALGVRLVEDEAGPRRELWVRKQRNGADAKGDAKLRWTYSLKTVDLDLIDEFGEAETSCVVKIDNDFEVVKRAPKLSPAAKIVHAAAVACISDFGRTNSGRTLCPPDRPGVLAEEVKDRARAMGLSASANKDPSEALRRTFSRAKEELIAKHQLFEMEGWVWLPRP